MALPTPAKMAQKVMKSLGLTYAELAEKLSTSASTAHRIANGETDPRGQTYRKLVELHEQAA